ncbi:hypothetical protein VTI74DRAFT_7710 [Chaetomium olivicolor]
MVMTSSTTSWKMSSATIRPFRRRPGRSTPKLCGLSQDSPTTSTSGSMSLKPPRLGLFGERNPLPVAQRACRVPWATVGHSSENITSHLTTIAQNADGLASEMGIWRAEVQERLGRLSEAASKSHLRCFTV